MGVTPPRVAVVIPTLGQRGDLLRRSLESLRAAGASFRNEIVTGQAGSQILLDDPSGNPVELFQPAA